jgi:very-short-patch-repair endonuclease
MTFSPALQEGIIDLAIGRAERVAKTFEHVCESPIEIGFGTAFVTFVDNIGKTYSILRECDETFSTEAAIAPQMRIGRYRVDFLVAMSKYNRRAIVECDGRDFHHSTRTQIERDRKRDADLESSGYKVFRFPGTQIHNEPFACVEQVLMWLIDSPRWAE